MRKGLLADSPPFTQLIMLLFTMVTCFLLFMFMGILLAPPILGIPIAELMHQINNGNINQNLSLMRYMQTLHSVSLFTVPAFFAAYLFSETVGVSTKLNVAGYLGLRQSVSVKWFGAVLLLVVAVNPFINLLGALNEMIVFPESMAGLEQRLKASEEAAQQMIKLFLDVESTGGILFNIFMMAVLPALGEELIFRGILQKIFVRWTGNVHLAIIVTGLLFSMMHLQFYGLFPRWLLGVMFGYMLVWSGTIWLPIFAHFVQNSVAVFLSWLIHKGTIPEEIETFGATWGDIPITIVATTICVWLFWKIKTKKSDS